MNHETRQRSITRPDALMLRFHLGMYESIEEAYEKHNTSLLSMWLEDKISYNEMYKQFMIEDL